MMVIMASFFFTIIRHLCVASKGLWPVKAIVLQHQNILFWCRREYLKQR